MATNEQAAEAAFAAYDFDSDAAFSSFREKGTVMAASADEEIQILRRAYFRRHVNPNLPKTSAGKGQPAMRSPGAASASPNRSSEPRSQPGSAARASRSTPATEPQTQRGSQSQWEYAFHRLLTLLSSPPSQLFFYFFILVTSFFTLLPIAGDRAWFYGKALLAASIVYVIGTLKMMGLPRLNREYLERMLTLDQVHYIFFCIAMRGAVPEILLALVPLVVFSTYGALDVMQRPVRDRFPQYREQYNALHVRAAQHRGTAQYYVALSELCIVPNILFNAFFSPINSLLLLFGYCQFLRTRYVKSAYTRSAFTTTDQKCRQLIAGYAPSIAPYYQKMCTHLRSLVVPPARAQ